MNSFTKHIKTLTLALSFLIALNSYSQAPQKTRILFVLDASQSMYGLWGQEQKMKVATRLLSHLMDSLKNKENIEVALRVYGHQFSVAAGNRSCEDTKLEVPFANNNFNKIKTKLTEIRPTGTTPIAYSLEQTKNDFPPFTNCKNIIILITDGIEECQGDPCAVALALQKNGVTLRPFVIGMGLDLETIEAFRCVGSFFETKDAASFENVLQIVISQVMNNTTVQVNLMDAFGKPTETDVNMTFYDSFSKSIQYNFIHTINNYGVPDTVPINPAMRYDLVVHTLPEVTKKDIEITAGKHNIIGVDAPQGMLKMEMSGLNEYQDLKCLVRKHGDLKTFHVQNFEETTKYLVGDYDLEILTLPRININKVNIAQSHTTKVFIADPGIATIFLPAKGIASVFVEDNNTLKWIYNLSPNSTRETVILQPGNYRIVYRSVNSNKVIETKEKTFKITSGASAQIKF